MSEKIHELKSRYETEFFNLTKSFKDELFLNGLDLIAVTVDTLTVKTLDGVSQVIINKPEFDIEPLNS